MKLGISNQQNSISIHFVIINVLCWIASLLLPRIGIDLIEKFGLHYWAGSDFNPIQLVTYMFLHDTSSIYHLLFNMVCLYTFGTVLERAFGTKRFLIYYFFTGIGAGLIQELAWAYDLHAFTAEVAQLTESGIANGLDIGNGTILHSVDELTRFADDVYNKHITVGASGAMFGLLIAFGLLFPNAPLFIMFIPIPIKAKYLVVGYALLELFAGVKDFSFDNVAHFAHLGGMLFGLILLLYWRYQGKKKFEQNQQNYGR